MDISSVKGNLRSEHLTAKDLTPYAKCGHGTFDGKISGAGRSLLE
jgi:hypothetical protein